MNSILVIGICFGVIATLLDIIGTAIPYWVVASGEVSGVSVKSNTGLFSGCVEIDGETEKCISVDPALLPSWYKATQAMMLLSIFAIGAGTGLAILYGFVMKENKVLTLGAAIMTAAGAVCAVIGVIVFGAKTTEYLYSIPVNFHAGFGLAVVAAILAIPASVMFFISRNRNT